MRASSLFSFFCKTRSLSTYILERDTQISLSMVCVSLGTVNQPLHPITHILAPSTIDQTVINSHLSPTHCFPSCSIGLPPVPASTHGNSFLHKSVQLHVVNALLQNHTRKHTRHIVTLNWYREKMLKNQSLHNATIH